MTNFLTMKPTLSSVNTYQKKLKTKKILPNSSLNYPSRNRRKMLKKQRKVKVKNRLKNNTSLELELEARFKEICNRISTLIINRISSKDKGQCLT